MYISKQTEQYRKNYFMRAFKAASSRSSSYVYAAQTSEKGLTLMCWDCYFGRRDAIKVLKGEN